MKGLWANSFKDALCTSSKPVTLGELLRKNYQALGPPHPSYDCYPISILKMFLICLHNLSCLSHFAGLDNITIKSCQYHACFHVEGNCVFNSQRLCILPSFKRR